MSCRRTSKARRTREVSTNRTTTSEVPTPFAFDSSRTAYLSGSLNNLVTTNVSATTSEPFIFGSSQTSTTTFNFVPSPREVKSYTSDSDGEIASGTQRHSRTGRKSSRNSSPESIRICADCKNIPQMQCLHCSKQVCMICAQKHVALTDEQVAVAQQTLNEKMSILDRLSVAAKERVNAEHDKIIQQVHIERDQAIAQIDQLLEQEKKQLHGKATQLTRLSSDKISSYIQRMTTEMENLNEDNDQYFCVTCTSPKIQIQHKH